jgi:hypothetical protein
MNHSVLNQINQLMVGGLLLMMCLSTILLSCRQASQKAPASRAPAEILIKFKAEVPADSVQALTARLGLEKVRDIGALRISVYRVTSQSSAEQIIKDCQGSPLVEYAEPNREYRIPEQQN